MEITKKLLPLQNSLPFVAVQTGSTPLKTNQRAIRKNLRLFDYPLWMDAVVPSLSLGAKMDECNSFVIDPAAPTLGLKNHPLWTEWVT